MKGWEVAIVAGDMEGSGREWIAPISPDDDIGAKGQEDQGGGQHVEFFVGRGLADGRGSAEEGGAGMLCTGGRHGCVAPAPRYGLKPLRSNLNYVYFSYSIDAESRQSTKIFLYFCSVAREASTWKPVDTAHNNKHSMTYILNPIEWDKALNIEFGKIIGK